MRSEGVGIVPTALVFRFRLDPGDKMGRKMGILGGKKRERGANEKKLEKKSGEAALTLANLCERRLSCFANPTMAPTGRDQIPYLVRREPLCDSFPNPII
jgi:hypothetical protein